MALVLLYHRVGRSGDAPDPWNLSVSASNFAQHLEFLTSCRRALPLTEIVRNLGSSSVPADAVGVSFDDGYARSLAVALPQLRSAGVPATIFLAPELLGRPRFWWDRLADLCTTPEGRGRHRLLEETWRDLRSADFADRETRLVELSSQLGASEPATEEDRPLTVEEARSLACDLITLGSHTMSHPWLPDLAADRIEAEIASAHRSCREWNLDRDTLFAYPYGAHDPVVRSVVSSLPIGAAFTAEPRGLGRGTDRTAVPRLAVQDWTGDELAAVVDELEGVDRKRAAVASRVAAREGAGGGPPWGPVAGADRLGVARQQLRQEAHGAAILAELGSSLEEAAAGRERLAAALQVADARLGMADREIDDLRSRTQALLAVIDARVAELAAVRLELGAARAALEETRGRLRDLLASGSWRLTAPLRQAAKMLRARRR